MKHPLWEFDLATEDKPGQDETWVLPVKRLPVSSLANRIVATRVRLANASWVVAMLGNISLGSARYTKQFATLSVAVGERWFHLARYFDVGYSERSPLVLANALGLPVEDVFPISYDLTGIAVGLPEVVRGEITAEPKERLTREELIKLALET